MATSNTILVIDDDAHIRRVLDLKLRKHGFRVLLARNGQEGLQLVESAHPDVVICDINMPMMDGKTFCEKTDPLKRQRPFLTIVITARIAPEENLWIERMQQTLFLEKPFSLIRILETITTYQAAPK